MQRKNKSLVVPEYLDTYFYNGKPLNDGSISVNTSKLFAVVAITTA